MTSKYKDIGSGVDIEKVCVDVTGVFEEESMDVVVEPVK